MSASRMDLKDVFDLLKVALTMAVAGGGAAAAVANMSVETVRAEVREHAKGGTIHEEAARRISEVRVELDAKVDRLDRKLDRVKSDSARSAAMLELLLREKGIKVPKEEDAGTADDAGENRK